MDLTPLPNSPEARAPILRERILAFWLRHRTLLWMLHSLWALATGIVVIILARERYGFIPWVVLFLVLTWASTFLLGRGITGPAGPSPGVGIPGFRREATSYVMREMYQQTLFFLIPFYWYSTVIGSLNMGFPLLLGGLAALSCLDLTFDRLLRTSPVFGLVFLSMVSFAAMNLLVPILLPVGPEAGTSLAAVVALGSAVPLAMRISSKDRSARTRLALAGGGLLIVAAGFPQLVPPVPLRLQGAVFTSSLDRESLVPGDTLSSVNRPADLEGAIFVVAEVFAPSVMPTTMSLEWRHEGRLLRTSREIEIIAHDLGFRVWDGWGPENGPVPPGRYEVTLRTGRGRVFGVADLTLAES